VAAEIRSELNDIEPTWRDLKRHYLAHQTFTGPDDLDRAIHEPSPSSMPSATAIRWPASVMAA
jgi:hypothetical protein